MNRLVCTLLVSVLCAAAGVCQEIEAGGLSWRQASLAVQAFYYELGYRAAISDQPWIPAPFRLDRISAAAQIYKGEGAFDKDLLREWREENLVAAGEGQTREVGPDFFDQEGFFQDRSQAGWKRYLNRFRGKNSYIVLTRLRSSKNGCIVYAEARAAFLCSRGDLFEMVQKQSKVEIVKSMLVMQAEPKSR